MKDPLLMKKMESLWEGIFLDDIRQMVIQDIVKEEETIVQVKSHESIKQLQAQAGDISIVDLLERVCHIEEGDKEIFWAIILQWKNIHQGLMEQIREFFLSTSDGEAGFLSLDPEENIQRCYELADSFLQYSPQFEAQRVFFLTALFLFEQEATKEEETFPSLAYGGLQQFLQEMASWSPFHVAWDEVESFICCVKDLSAAKIAQQKKKRKELQQALFDLAERTTLLKFFQMQEMASWSLEHIPRDMLEETYSYFFTLKTALDSYATLLQKRPETVTERQSTDERLYDLEEEILVLYQDLGLCFKRKEQTQDLSVPSPSYTVNPKFFFPEGDLGPEWENIYSLVEKGDLTGAYWMVRSQKEEAVYAHLFKAVQGSWWLPGHEGVFYRELKELFQELKGGDTPLQRLLFLSASILPAFFAPEIVVKESLQERLGLPVVDAVLEKIIGNIEGGFVFRLEDLPGHQGMLEREMKIGAFVKKAKAFLEPGRIADLSYQSFLLLKRLLKPDSELYSILRLVADDERDDYQRLVPLLQRWEDTAAVKEYLVGLSRDGVAQDLLNHLQVLVRNAFGWYYMVDQNERIQRDENYFKRLEDCSNFFILKSTPLLSALDALLKEDLGFPIQVGLHSVKTSFAKLAVLFHPTKKEGRDSSWWIKESISLEASLSRRLLWIPQLELGSYGESHPSSLDDIQPFLLRTPPTQQNLVKVLPLWTEKGDYRFTERILDACPADESRDLTQQVEAKRKKKEKNLLLVVQKTLHQIERVYQGGAIPENRRFFLKSRLNISETICQFHPLWKQVEEVEKELEQIFDAGLKDKERDWEEIRSRFREGRPVPCLEEIKKALNRQDLLTIGRYLAALDHYLETGSGEFLPANPYLTTFMKQVYSIERYAISDSRFRLLSRALQKGSTWGNINFGHLSPSQREEAEKVLKAYMQLKKRPFSRGESLIPSLESVLSFTGFIFFETQKDCFSVLQEKEDWIHFHVRMSAGRQAFPFPQFGSMTHGNYQLLLLQEKPGTDTLGNFLQSTLVKETDILLILYLGRLTGFQRHQLLKANRERRVVSAVMDELLFLHLLGRSRERLQAFLHCSQPFSSLIPYLPDREGELPPEVFFGRRLERDKILQHQGVTLLCGGLKTGKTALLHHLQRQVHHPEMDRFAAVVDMKGETGSGADGIFTLLKTMMNRWGFTRDDGASIPRQIQDILAKNPQLKVYILFDNADVFFHHDPVTGGILSHLQEFIQESGGRFNLVFSGSQGLLSHLQQSWSFVQTLLLGSLEPEAAAELVEKPLESLGFVLDSEARQFLLSKTECNPYLLQSFCSRLLQKLYQNHDRFRNLRNDGITITLEDVQAVYPALLTLVRERLEKTIQLHPLYEILFYGMLMDMKYNGRSPGTAYSTREVEGLLRSLQPKGEMYPGRKGVIRLLQDLSILDVLSRAGEEGFVFRYGDLMPHLTVEELSQRLMKALLWKKEE